MIEVLLSPLSQNDGIPNMGSEIKDLHGFRNPEEMEAEKMMVLDNKKAKTDLVIIAGKLKDLYFALFLEINRKYIFNQAKDALQSKSKLVDLRESFII